jgi:hypothetical protein
MIAGFKVTQGEQRQQFIRSIEGKNGKRWRGRALTTSMLCVNEQRVVMPEIRPEFENES